MKQSNLFESASRQTRDVATAAGEVAVAPAGTALLRQGSVPDAMLLLARGRVRVERAAPDGRLMPLGYRGAGELLGETSLALSAEHLDTATTMEEVEYVRLPVALMRDLAAQDPTFFQAIFALLLARQRETEDRIESLLFRNVEGRLVEFLLQAADRWGVPSPKGTLISAPITHLEIAQSIGSTRETVTLTLGALRRQGLLDVAGRRLIVCDREALAAR